MAEQGEVVELEEDPADKKTVIEDKKERVQAGEEIKIVSDKEETKDEAKDEDDERVGHGEVEETAEERRERNRQERREKKKRRNEYRERDALEMRYLRQRNEELERNLGTMDSRVTMTEAAAIDQRIETIKAQIAQANDVMGKATAAQDSTTYSEALTIKDDLQKSLTRLEGAKAERLQTAKRPAPTRELQRQQVDPRVENYGAMFMKDNPWYDPAGGDEDSAIALAIDATLIRSGFDPRTEKYWAELRSRLKKRLPERFAAKGDSSADPDDDDDDDEDDEPSRPSASKAPVKPQKRDAPTFPSGGQSKPLKPGQVFVSAERKAAMIEAGVWDDPVLRTRMLRRYQKYDQDQSTRNRK